MHYVTINKTHTIYTVCGRNFLDACSLYPLLARPLPFRRRGISRKGRDFQTKISWSWQVGSWPLKKTCQHIFHQITTPPRSLTWTMIQIERLHFRHIWSMMTRSIHDCWHVRTNKCVRTNMCKTSVFFFSVENTNIFGRIEFFQFLEFSLSLQVYFVRTP